jgi:hypothetical protein
VRHEDDGGRRLVQETLQHVVPSKSRSFVGSSRSSTPKRESRIAASEARAACPAESALAGSSSRSAGFPRAVQTALACGVRSAPPQREEPIQRGGVPLGQPRLAPEARRERVHGLLGFEDAAAAGGVAEQRLAVLDVGLLRQVAARERPWSALDAAEVRLLEPGEDPQQRRLPDPVPDVGTLEPGSCLQHFVASTDRGRRGSWCDPPRPAWEGSGRRAEL